MSIVARNQHYWRSAFWGMRQSPFVHSVAVLTIAIALFSAGLARSSTRIVEALIGSLGGEVEMTLYLSDALSDEKAAAVAKAASSTVGGEAKLVSSDAAMRALSGELGELGVTLKDLPRNPLPRSVELKVPPNARSPGALRAHAASISKLEGVTGVDYGAAAVERLSAIASALRYGGLAAFFIVVIATVIIVASTLQLAIYARREEIEIQKLVGATDSFVKAPFLIEGLVQGLFGAGVAVLALVMFDRFVGPRAASLFGFLVGPGASFTFQDPRTLLEMTAAGALLGLCGSFLAVGRFLRV